MIGDVTSEMLGHQYLYLPWAEPSLRRERAPELLACCRST